MTVKCGWCGKEMGEKPGPSDMVTHSMCSDCEREQYAELAAKNEAVYVKAVRRWFRRAS